MKQSLRRSAWKLVALVVVAAPSSIVACFVSTTGLSDGPMDASTFDATAEREAAAAAADSTTPPAPDTGALPVDAAMPADAAPDAQMDAGSDASPYTAAVLGDHPKAYWPFDEPAGSTLAIDVIGGLSAAAQGTGLTFGVPGANGTAVSFDSTSQLAVGDHLDLLGSDPFAVEFWAKADHPDAGVYQNYLAKRAGPDDPGYVVYLSPGADVQFEEKWTDDAGLEQREGDLEPNAFTDYFHVVWTLDLTNHVHLYVNGIEATREFNGPAGGPGPNGISLTIGGQVVGEMDELAYYDHELTALQVNAHYLARSK